MIDNQELTFAGSYPGTHWESIGLITRGILSRYGYKVKLIEAPGTKNTEYVDNGKADIGVTSPILASIAISEGQKIENIANVSSNIWLGIAVKKDTRIKSIEEIKEKKMSIKLLAGEPAKDVLKEYNVSFDDIRNWGGEVYPIRSEREGYKRDSYPSKLVREGKVNLIIDLCCDEINEFGTHWRTITTLGEVDFLCLEKNVIENLIKKNKGLKKMVMPERTFEGLEEDVQTVGLDHSLVYCRKDKPKDLSYLIAKTYDENPKDFISTNFRFFYNPKLACKETVIPFHEGAEEYYKEKGIWRLL